MSLQRGVKSNIDGRSPGGTHLPQVVKVSMTNMGSEAHQACQGHALRGQDTTSAKDASPNPHHKQTAHRPKLRDILQCPNCEGHESQRKVGLLHLKETKRMDDQRQCVVLDRRVAGAAEDRVGQLIKSEYGLHIRS